MMMVEVTDASGKYVAVNGVTAKVGTSESATKITNKYTDLAFGSINDQLDAAISGFDFNF